MTPQTLLAFVAGLLFAGGLGLAQMTRPDVVIGFLDVADWDPRLALVMGGAVGVHLVPTWLGLRRGRALFGPLHLPEPSRVDWRLVLGSVLFGLGWGLAGYCPGPALVAAAAGSLQAVWLLAGMVLGMVGLAQLERLLSNQSASNRIPTLRERTAKYSSMPLGPSMSVKNRQMPSRGPEMP